MTNIAQTLPTARPAFQPRRLWLAVFLVSLFWAFDRLNWRFDMTIFGRFMAMMAARLGLAVAFLVWWLSNGAVRRGERWLTPLGFLVMAASVGFLAGPVGGGFGVFLFGLPIALSVGVLWLLVSQDFRPAAGRAGMWAALGLGLASILLVRLDGLSGEGRSEISWRWSPTVEQRYLAGLTTPAAATRPTTGPATVAADDWPGFRGEARDGRVAGLGIATDWNANPPRRLWHRPIGHAWSSMCIVGDRLYTQEQRGEKEAVVCLDAGTGKDVWIHTDNARFFEPLAGAGPRATPTFAGGRVYCLGGTGILNCLDAGTGKLCWSRNIAADAPAVPPVWGFSGSPLVVDGVVIVFAGGDSARNLLGYRIDTGEIAWTTPAGKDSYASPQLLTIDGSKQVMFFSDRSLLAVDPGTGKMLWEHALAGKAGVTRCLQPQAAGGGRVVVGSEVADGTVMLELKRSGSAWSANRVWSSRDIKPWFNDLVMDGNALYGFDGNVFCCVDLETGKRRWRQGRFGQGQVLVLAEAHQLVVLAESGEVVLLAANPETLEELGRFQAIEGKTWNHPAIARGRLYVRNGEAMACYELRAAAR